MIALDLAHSTSTDKFFKLGISNSVGHIEAHLIALKQRLMLSQLETHTTGTWHVIYLQGDPDH